MTTQELNNKIERVLGNNIRCLLPSYWWKNLLHSVADRIDEVEQKVDGIEIPDGVPIVNYKSELNGLKLPKGSVASVVTEGYGFSQCYLPTKEEVLEGIEAVFPKLTRIMNIERRDYQLEESEVGVAYLMGMDYPNTYLMVICQIIDGAQLYAAKGVVNGKDVAFYMPRESHRLNDMLAENDLRFAEIASNTEQGIEEMLTVLDKAFAINGTSDVYTKGASWEKLAKESDITGEGGNTSGDGLIFGKERYAYVSKHKDVNGNITELGLSEEHMAYNQETYEMLESGDKVYLSYEGTFWMQVGYAGSHFYFSTASMVLPYDNKVFGRMIELSSDGEIALIDTLVGDSSEEVQNLRNEIITNEKIHAAALDDLGTKIRDIEARLNNAGL